MTKLRHKIQITLALSLAAVSSAKAQSTWDGGGGDNLWTTPLNWLADLAPVSPGALTFDGTTQLTTQNDFAANTQFNGLIFAPTAGAFTLNGNAVTIGGNVVNNSTALQTINLGLVSTATRTFTTAAGGGDIVLNGGYTSTGFFTKTGTGTLTISSAFNNGARFHIGGVNSSVVIGTGGSVVNNDLAAGFNSIGNSASSVVNLNLQGNGSFLATKEVALADNGGLVTSTLNVSDTATFTALRLIVGKNGNAGTAAGTGIVNQNGGIVDLTGTGDTVSTLTSDGLGLGARTGGHVDSSGTYNLNGGTLKTYRIVMNPVGSGIFNFNGGTVKPIANQTTFMPTDARLTANVQAGGAIIDTDGFDITISAVLQHDPSLFAEDGGLIKRGSGILTLAGVNTYNGDTKIEGGTLSLANPYLADTADVWLTSGSILDLTFTGQDIVANVYVDGLLGGTGTWGGIGSLANHETALITGPGMLLVVPEPSILGLSGLALLALVHARRRRA